MLRLLALALLPILASAAGDENLTLPEYRKGLKELRGHFVKRGEDPVIADRYIANLETAFPIALGERVPVTKTVFDAFLKYQAAWARKTRDSKNPGVTPAQLRHEVERAQELKAAFKAKAEAESPRFYQAFQAAVQDVRSIRSKGGSYTGTSAVFFSDQVDDSYTHVDAGDEALEKGDTAKALKEADEALRINPGNADALVLRAGARYERKELPEAIADAQAALILDPVNLQAQTILSLTQSSPNAAQAIAAVNALSFGDARASATPGVGRMLSEDLSVRAVGAADSKDSLSQLGQAMALDPKNANASGWYATIANRQGEYGAALGATERELKNDPNDALAYFNRAYALAGNGNRAGMVEALERAAAIDPVYRGVADRAATLDTGAAMDAMFGLAPKERQPLVPKPRRRNEFPLMLMTSFIASFLLVSGAMLFFRSGPRPSVSRL